MLQNKRSCMKRIAAYGGFLALFSSFFFQLTDAFGADCPPESKAVVFRAGGMDDLLENYIEEGALKDPCDPLLRRETGVTASCNQARRECFDQAGDRILQAAIKRCIAIERCDHLRSRLRTAQSAWVCSKDEAERIVEDLAFPFPSDVRDLCVSAGNLGICFPPANCP